MKQGESVNDYFGRVMIIVDDMRNYGEKMDDIKIVEKILRTLTDKWNYIVCSTEESKDIDTLSVDALQSSLMVHEQKFKKEGGEEQALAVSYYEGQGGRERGRNTSWEDEVEEEVAKITARRLWNATNVTSWDTTSTSVQL